MTHNCYTEARIAPSYQGMDRNPPWPEEIEAPVVSYNDSSSVRDARQSRYIGAYRGVNLLMYQAQNYRDECEYDVS